MTTAATVPLLDGGLVSVFGEVVSSVIVAVTVVSFVVDFEV